MYVQRRDFLLLVTLAAVAAMPALGQTPASSGTQGAASIPDFSGIWGHLSAPPYEPPLTGPGPVTNLMRVRQTSTFAPGNGALASERLASNPGQFVGDYTNPILKPEAAEIVKQHGDISRTGVVYPTPSNQCWPGGVPYVFWNIGMQMLQQKDAVTILYINDRDFRHVRLNAQHPAHVTPSWYGDSVGHYEGDMLVIGTVGIKKGPFAMLDSYGTPFTERLHVVERYRLIDHDAAKEVEERPDRDGFDFVVSDNGLARDPDYKGKALQLDFTVEDEGVFTTPWSARVTYQRPLGDWAEFVCAENMRATYVTKDSAVPRADKPDF
jgi:hypothetical protein